MDLQLFAEERTEEATPRRLQEARKEGRVPRSQDLGAGISLVVAAMALNSVGSNIYEQAARGMVETFSHLGGVELTVEETAALGISWALLFFKAILPLVGLILLVGLLFGLLQGQFAFSLKPLAPDLNRINPLQGIKRMFSLHSLMEHIKALLKLAVIGYIGYREIRQAALEVPDLMGQSVALGLSRIFATLVTALRNVGFALLAVGVLDYAYQFWDYRRSLRMTKEEVKQEFKQQEGNPEIKSRQRQRQREMAMRRRAIKEVPKADVVVTNPTHYAVALRYEADKDVAPRVIAKGADLMAQQIKAIAREHQVPLVENRPLARRLYDTVPLGKPVPPELFQAVAEVLAFVYNLRRQGRRQQQS